MESEKPQVKDLYIKLLEIQNEFTSIKKTEENPFFKSKYFDINSLISAIRPVLKEYDLILLQPLEFKDGKSLLTTRLIDVHTNQEVSSSIELPTLNDPQKIGASITYYRRFSIQTLFLLEAVDDDAETGAGRGTVELQEKKEKWKEELAGITSVKDLAKFHKDHEADQKYLLPLLTKRKKEIESANSPTT